MATNVRTYKIEELIKYVKTLPDYKYIPKDYWNIWVRSNEDEFNKFDDKRYFLYGTKLINVSPCTTNKGAKGTAVIKSNQWLYDGFIFGLHKEKMECFRQNKPFYFYRDTNENIITDETGDLFFENIQTQWHGSTYNKGMNVIREEIGAWSEGCLVDSDNLKYEKDIALSKSQKILTGCLIKEF